MWLLIANVVMLSLLAGLWIMLTQPVLRVRAVPTRLRISSERLRAHVLMLSETLTPRDYNHPENLDRAAAYIQRELEQSRGKVSEQPYKVNGTTYRNVVALFGPDAKERIVVGAHYDTCMPYPGADDNASGIAGLIELAGLLGGRELPVQVELVAYTLEEPPFFRSPVMGIAVHAQSLRQQDIRVRAMFALEMIGYFSDAPGSQEFPNPVFKLFYP